jgi:hypothetical protein
MSCPSSGGTFSTNSGASDYYLKPYTATQSVLPASGTVIINSDGSVNSTNLNTHVTQVMNLRAKPPTVINPEDEGDKAKTFADQATALRASMNDEYCYYYSRYLWAMQRMLSDATRNGAVDPQLKLGVIELNKKLNIILLIMKTIVTSRMNTLGGYYGNTDQSISALNTQLDTARQSLKNHSMKLEKNDMEEDVRRSMVEYSVEKNDSTKVLLTVYGFLNLLAAGMLYYIYTGTK